MQVIEQRDADLLLGMVLAHLAEYRHQLALSRFGVHRRDRPLRVGNSEEVEHQRKRFVKALIEQHEGSRDLPARLFGVVLILNAVHGTKDLQARRERNGLAV